MSVTNLHVVSIVASPSSWASVRTDGAAPCAEKTMRSPCSRGAGSEWTVGNPSCAISRSTDSLWTTCPRIAPVCPFFTAMRTSLSATRTPAQKPYFSARTTSKDRSLARTSAPLEVDELDLLRHDLHEPVALAELEALAAAADDGVVRGEEHLVPLVALEPQDGALLVLAEERGAGDPVVLRELDAEDAAAGAREDRDLVGLEEDGSALLRRDGDEVALLREPDEGDLVSRRGLREAPAGARRRLVERLVREAEDEAAPRHREEERLLGEDTRVEGERRDDALLVVEAEELLHRLAVAGGWGHFVELHDVSRAVVREEDRRLLRRALEDGEESISLAQARLLRGLQFPHALQPALGRDDPERVLVLAERLGARFR